MFVCLAGDIQMSTYPGRIIVTEPKGAVQPRINVEKHSLRHVVLNGQTTLPCIAQGKNKTLKAYIKKIINNNYHHNWVNSDDVQAIFFLSFFSQGHPVPSYR